MKHILFVPIIFRGDTKWKDKNKDTHEVSWDITRWDKYRKTKGWSILSIVNFKGDKRKLKV